MGADGKIVGGANAMHQSVKVGYTEDIAIRELAEMARLANHDRADLGESIAV